MKAPKMVPGTVENVSVEWLLANIRSSVDSCNNAEGYFDALALMKSKVNDMSMAPLFESVLEAGFTVPICLYRPMRFDDDSDAYVRAHPEGEWGLGNGHHRFTLALLMGTKTMPVYWDKDDDYMNVHSTEGDELGWNPDKYTGMIPSYTELFMENRDHLKSPFEVIGTVLV